MKNYLYIIGVMIVAGAAIIAINNTYSDKKNPATSEEKKIEQQAEEITPQKKEEVVKEEGKFTENCDQFGEKMKNCEEYNCSTKAIDDENFFINHSIKGFGADNKCKHIQITPEGQVECNYSEKTRMIVAASLGKDNKLSDEDARTLADSFAIECSVSE